MDKLLQAIHQFPTEKISYESLGTFVKDFDYSQLSYKEHLPQAIPPGEYGRNILTLKPFECVLIYWPPSVESAIHFHHGFYGYVVILEGELDNVIFKHEHGTLAEYRIMRYFDGGVADEPENVIHKLANPSHQHYAVTLHFYYPALDTLEDLVIYHPEKGAEGTLSKEATSASWSDKPGHFKSVKEGIFTFMDMPNYYKDTTHVMFPVIPKPSEAKISKMVANYYCEQARKYDGLDTKHPSRRAYTQKINELMADHLKASAKLDRVLHIGTGTGRRALEIREACISDYELYGVDISPKMCEVAKERGIHMVQADWLKAELAPETQFDAVAWLYAFGHVATEQTRKASLTKIYQHLRSGGSLFLDVFNVENKNEWGPKASHVFNELSLQSFGYQSGDVFYKRTDGKELAFVHYFHEEEIRTLLEEVGFHIDQIYVLGYAVDSGELKKDHSEGFYFIHAKKRALS